MLGRYMNLIVMVALEHAGEESRIHALKEQYTVLMDIMVDLLGLHPDYSMLDTLNALKETAPVNPRFEHTLKQNLCNSYCLQAAYEPARFLYRKEIDIGFHYLMAGSSDKTRLTEERKAILSEFWEKPLSDMQPNTSCDIALLISAAADAIRSTESLLFP